MTTNETESLRNSVKRERLSKASVQGQKNYAEAPIKSKFLRRKKMASDAASAQTQNAPQMKKTLSLAGLTINAMALIAPGAFLWITLQVQAAQTDPAGASTASDIWFGLFAALILAFLTAASYAWLARRYPESGAGSSYYFAQRAWLDRGSSNRSARNAKFAVGWLSHLYYWVYPGVMVAFMAVILSWVLTTLGFSVSPLAQIAIAFAFSADNRFHSLPRNTGIN